MDLLNKPLLSSLLLLLLLYLVKSQDMLNAVSYYKRKSQTGYDSETYNVKLKSVSKRLYRSEGELLFQRKWQKFVMANWHFFQINFKEVKTNLVGAIK